MSLQRLRHALAEVEFKPHTVALGPSDARLRAAMSPGAAALVDEIVPGDPTVEQRLSAAPWPDAVMGRYRELSRDERMEVLAVAGFHVHELIHKVDFLTTPFGVGFHGRACLETVGLQLDGAELFDRLERSDPHSPLRDMPNLSERDLYVVNRGPEVLNARIRWFDAMRGAAPKHVRQGWGGDSQTTLSFGNRELAVVEVHELMPTLALPGEGSGYLRPLTILESRAVAVTGLNLLQRLGGDRFAATEVAQFVEAFYSPASAYPDYRFLLDLFTDLWGQSDLVTAVEELGADWLQSALLAMVLLGWYALHATPEVREDTAANASPVVRLMTILQEYLAAVRNGWRWPDAVAFFDELDSSDYGRQLGLTSGKEILSYCVNYLERVRKHNYMFNPHEELGAHFESILLLQQREMMRRYERGYSSFIGMPEGGDLLAGPEADADHRLLETTFEPARSVDDWFRLRECLLFRHARPPGFWDELWNFVSPPWEGALPTPPEEATDVARTHALARTQLVASGTWPHDSGLITSGDERDAFVALPAGDLAETFRRHDEGETDDIETRWGVFGNRGDPWFALDISFKGIGESVRLILSLRRHREIVEQVVAAKRLVMVSLDDAAALRAGELQKQLLRVPVEADHSPVAWLLRDLPRLKLVESAGRWRAELHHDGSSNVAMEAAGVSWPTVAAADAVWAALGPDQRNATIWRAEHPEDGESRRLVACAPPALLEPLVKSLAGPGGGSLTSLSEDEALRHMQLLADAAVAVAS